MKNEEMCECARCKKQFPVSALQTLEIANENFRKLANAIPSDDFPLYASNKTLESLGFDTSMIFCATCKAYLDNLVKKNQDLHLS